MPAWVLDFYPARGGIAVWLIDERGRPRRVVDPWFPTFYVDGPAPRVGGIEAFTTERREFYSNRPKRVTAVRVLDPRRFRAASRGLSPERLYDADIPVAQLYAYDRGIFPFARVDDDLRVLDDPHALDYALPPLRILEIGIEGAKQRASLVVKFNGVTEVLDSEASLADIVKRENPDIVATSWGDSFLIPRLEGACDFHRDHDEVADRRGSRSYFGYGRMVHNAGLRTFLGRLHLDMENSFMVREAGLDGLFDLARLSRIPIQQLARATIGTAISSMQLAVAFREGYLIPCEKRQTEKWKTAEELLTTDKGGLTYLPTVGLHGGVAELDFASMYPTIMANFNVSPETMNCACCAGRPVPEIGHRTCEKRRGLVPRVLEPLLTRRAEYRRRRDAGIDVELHDRRQSALKWCLVCCFGYLGFRNARFGKIEAHEAVTSYSREILLRAKEIAEARGFRMLHAIVDSLWVKGEGDPRELGDAIARETGLPIALEGVYKWIHFYPSRSNPRVGVHNRYAGAFESGKLKVRGIELRRHDTPRIVREAQSAALAVLARASGVAEFRALVPEARSAADEVFARLREGRVGPAELAVKRHLSRAPRDYAVNNFASIAAKQMLACGMKVEQGEGVAYIVMDDRSPVVERRAIALALALDYWDYDPAWYAREVTRALDSILGAEAPKPKKADPQLTLF